MSRESEVKELLLVRNGRIYHREGQELEFKEQFNFAGLAEYIRDFAAFANNRGGYLIFGVKDAPRKRTGLSTKSAEQFERTDPQVVSGHLLETFSGHITWEQLTVTIGGKPFGAFYVHEAAVKPIIAKKDEGKGQEIRNGDVYFRYGGRTQRIQHAELETIISARVDRNNRNWLDLLAKIGRAGPENAAILDTERGLIEKDESRILVLDEGLAAKLKFIKEGQFKEKEGAPTRKLVGDITAVEAIEVVKHVRENLIKAYPLSATELARAVQAVVPGAKQHDVWRAIRDNGIKDNPDYSAYNFRNKSQEDKYLATGEVPTATPSIYNGKAVNLVAAILIGEDSDGQDA